MSNELEEINIDTVNPDWLESVDLEIPDDYLTEIMARKLLDTIGAYHTSEVDRKALRHQGDHVKAEQLAKQAATLRTVASIIQHQYPRTVQAYKELAKKESKGK
jgi:hypothetical protein